MWCNQRLSSQKWQISPPWFMITGEIEKSFTRIIDHQISFLDNYQSLNRSLMPFNLERNFGANVQKYEKHTDFFEKY